MTRATSSRVVLVSLAVAALLAGMLALFAWPAARATPHDLPITVAGPPPATAQVAAGLEHARPGAFQVTQVSDREAAVRSITDHTSYGAIVAAPGGAEILTASARSPVVAQMLGQLGTQLAGARGTPVQTTDVVPLPQDDPRGAGLTAALLPIVLGGLLCAAALRTVARGRGAQLSGVLIFAVAGGLLMTWMLQGWLGSLSGNLVANAGVLILGIIATALTALGLERVLGPAGLGLAAVLFMLFGNALSGAASAPELLPRGWGVVGQVLPAGATNTALRSVAFFDGAGAAVPFLVLGVWATIGAVLLALPSRTRGKASRTSTTPSSATDAVTSRAVS